MRSKKACSRSTTAFVELNEELDLLGDKRFLLLANRLLLSYS